MFDTSAIQTAENSEGHLDVSFYAKEYGQFLNSLESLKRFLIKKQDKLNEWKKKTTFLSKFWAVI